MVDEVNVTVFGDLGKPAKELIERISNAIGIVYYPYNQRRIARADAEVNEIKALAQQQISRLNDTDSMEKLIGRTQSRVDFGNIRDQINIESVLEKTLPLLNEESNPSQLDDDWMKVFFDRCASISDGEVQGIWARLLASEAGKVGSYSIRTLRLLSELSKDEQQKFQEVCQFTWIINGIPHLIISDSNDNIYHEHFYPKLLILESSGLIKINDVANTFYKVDPSDRNNLTQGIFIRHVDELFTIRNVEKTINIGMDIPLGMAFFTPVGKELLQLVKRESIPDFIEHSLDFWSDFQITGVTEINVNNFK